RRARTAMQAARCGDLRGAGARRDPPAPAVLEALEPELQRIAPARQARHADDLHDLLADIGPLSHDEIAARCAVDAGPLLDALLGERRVILVGGAYAAAEDASRLRDALGWAIPQGLPAAFTDPVERPLDDLV